MATQKIKWYKKDGTLLHPVTEWGAIENAPTAMKNPSALSITAGGKTIRYDGSSEQSITIPSGGGSAEPQIQFRINYISYNRKTHDVYVGLRFLSGFDLLDEETDELVFAAMRKVTHNKPYRRSLYKYRPTNKIYADELVEEGQVTFFASAAISKTDRGGWDWIVRSNGSGKGGSGGNMAKKAIYIRRKPKGQNAYRVSNMVTFMPVARVNDDHNMDDVGRISFVIDSHI